MLVKIGPHYVDPTQVIGIESIASADSNIWLSGGVTLVYNKSADDVAAEFARVVGLAQASISGRLAPSLHGAAGDSLRGGGDGVAPVSAAHRSPFG